MTQYANTWLSFHHWKIRTRGDNKSKISPMLGLVFGNFLVSLIQLDYWVCHRLYLSRNTYVCVCVRVFTHTYIQRDW